MGMAVRRFRNGLSVLVRRGIFRIVVVPKAGIDAQRRRKSIEKLSREIQAGKGGIREQIAGKYNDIRREPGNSLSQVVQKPGGRVPIDVEVGEKENLHPVKRRRKRGYGD